jgi:hypothetical protein
VVNRVKKYIIIQLYHPKWGALPAQKLTAKSTLNSSSARTDHFQQLLYQRLTAAAAIRTYQQ